MSDPEYDPTTYGSSIADVYDAMYDGVYDSDGAVAFIAERAGGGPILELGVGTGRLALPLVARGLEVHGVDASPEMLEQLAAKPGGAKVPVACGDFATVVVQLGHFEVVVLAINTIFALPDQDAQVAVFENAARHLRPGGCFIVEAWIPDMTRFARGQGMWPRRLAGGEVSLEVGRIDRAQQMMYTTQIRFGAEGVRTFPADHRYAWPAELDLMARLAGLRFARRYEDWTGTPFTNESWTHVSVYDRA